MINYYSTELYDQKRLSFLNIKRGPFFHLVCNHYFSCSIRHERLSRDQKSAIDVRMRSKKEDLICNFFRELKDFSWLCFTYFKKLDSLLQMKFSVGELIALLHIEGKANDSKIFSPYKKLCTFENVTGSSLRILWYNSYPK